MIRRVLSLLLGLGLFATVVALGLKARVDQSFVTWFGLAAAILAPGGFAAIGYALTAPNRQILERLSRVPEIEKLINEAKNQEDKIRLLEQERSKLLQIVELEARKQSIIARKELIERDGIRVLNELDTIDREMAELDLQIESSSVTEEVKKLRGRLQARRRGDIVFRIGSNYFTLRKDLFIKLPFGGFALEYFKALDALMEALAELGNQLFRWKRHKPDKK